MNCKAAKLLALLVSCLLLVAPYAEGQSPARLAYDKCRLIPDNRAEACYKEAVVLAQEIYKDEKPLKLENKDYAPFLVDAHGKQIFTCENCPKKFCKEFSCTMSIAPETGKQKGDCSCID